MPPPSNGRRPSAQVTAMFAVHTPFHRRLPVLVIALLLSSLTFWPAQAQHRNAAPATLAAVLERIQWSTKPGVLLVVDPEHTYQDTPSDSTHAEIDPSPMVSALATEFNRQAVSLGDVTAIVPKWMTVLNPDPGPADLLRSMDRNERMRLLESSLNPGQWGQFGSSQGLGLGDLTSEQASVFLSLLPKPFAIKTAVADALGEYSSDPSATRVLTDGERATVHLRLSLSTQVGIVPHEGVQSCSILGGPTIRQAGDTFMTADGAPDRLDPDSAYGVPLSAQIPNQPKPSSLSLATPSLSVTIPFGSIAATSSPVHVLSVGELVHRIGVAAHLELYADRRVAGLPVWVRGPSAPADDLLGALCLCLSSTFRQVGTAYVLTDDLLGIGTRHARIVDWAQAADAQRRQMLDDLQSRISSQWPADSLKFSEADPLAQDTDLARRVWAGRGGNVLITDIPAPQQAFFRQYVARALAQNQPVHSDRVSINLNLRLSYVIPGTGEVQDSAEMNGTANDLMPRKAASASLESGVTPLVTFPAGWQKRILLVSLEDQQDAQRVINEAYRRGLNEVWMEVDKKHSTDALRAAITAGRKRQIPVLALVRLLRQPGIASDLNVVGETEGAYLARAWKAVSQQTEPTPSMLRVQDWNSPVDSNFSSAVLPWLTTLAKTPELAGIVIRDSAAPGYSIKQTTATVPGQSLLAAADLGYTTRMRLAFLRRNGMDPVDLIVSDSGLEAQIGPGTMTLPFYPDADLQSSSVQMWNAFRLREAEALIKQSYATLRAANPGMTLMLGEKSGAVWYSSWDAPNARANYDATLNDTYAKQARSQSRLVFLSTPCVTESTSPHEYAKMVNHVLPRVGANATWNGFVLDMSAVDSGKTMSLLSVFADQQNILH